MAAKGKLFLIHWNDALGQQLARALNAEGWRVELESEDGHRAFRLVRRYAPDVVVVDLTQRPSLGRETARSIRAGAATRDMPIVFLDGEDSAREAARAALPEALFTTRAQLASILTRLWRNVPRQEE